MTHPDDDSRAPEVGSELADDLAEGLADAAAGNVVSAEAIREDLDQREANVGAVEITAWLRAQIAAEKARADEDLRFAENAADGTWTVHEGGHLNASYLHVNGAEAAMYTGWGHRGNLMLAARFNPDAVAERARAVLAQCEAFTVIVDGILAWEHTYDEDAMWYACSQAVDPTEPGEPEPGSACVDDERRGKPCDCGLARRQMTAFKRVALAFQHQPGYREEWRP